MSQRGEDLGRFRDQMTPGGPSMPPRFFWFVMGVGFGVAIENAYMMSASDWSSMSALGLPGRS